MIKLICVSPKYKKSNSYMFLQNISNEKIFFLWKNIYDDLINDLDETIVISFPLYIDSVPSNLLDFFDYTVEKGIRLNNKKFYFIINCGFLEAKHCRIALSIVKNWCLKCESKYMGSILIGAGEYVGGNKNILTKKNYRLLKKFGLMVKDNRYCELETTISLPFKRLFCFFGNIYWKKKIEKN